MEEEAAIVQYLLARGSEHISMRVDTRHGASTITCHDARAFVPWVKVAHPHVYAQLKVDAGIL